MADPPTPEQINHLVRTALEEDLGSGDLGDITTRPIVDPERIGEAEVVAKEPLVVCGSDIFCAVFSYLDADASFPGKKFEDGSEAGKGEILVRVQARSVALLEGERVALNILQRFSGIATLTRRFVQRAKPVKVLDTRKTTPGLRVFEKYAVKCGGGENHRFGLFDAVLIKDNHIKAAGGITQAVETWRKNCSRELPIEVETTNLDEVREALAVKADIIMLDNMSLETIREAVGIITGKAKTEVSGTVTLERLDDLSTTGVDTVSVGALTHSAPAVDISMNFLEG